MTASVLMESSTCSAHTSRNGPGSSPTTVRTAATSASIERSRSRRASLNSSSGSMISSNAASTSARASVSRSTVAPGLISTWASPLSAAPYATMASKRSISASWRSAAARWSSDWLTSMVKKPATAVSGTSTALISLKRRGKDRFMMGLSAQVKTGSAARARRRACSTRVIRASFTSPRSRASANSIGMCSGIWSAVRISSR